MRTSARRLAAAALTTAVAAGSTLVAAPAPAATNRYAASATSWLNAQLTNGLVHNDQFGIDDYGLSLDEYFALKALGRPRIAGSILDAVRRNPRAYIEFESNTFAGATAKLATAVLTDGRNPRSFGGVNLVRRLQGLVVTSGAQAGRAKDQGATDFSNTIGQAFTVRALSGAHSGLADEATAFLLKQQCSRGFFREALQFPTEPTTKPVTFRCDRETPAATPSVDSTSFAVQALVAARRNGVRGLGDNLARAGTWLLSQQRPNGSFVGNGTPNTNTTGLAAAALVATGHRTAAERSAAWISRLQVSAAVAAAHPKLRREVGGIAYDAAALAAGRSDGIPVDQRDQWRRATAQAAIGVNAVRRLRVTAPHGFVHGGRTVPVRATGLASGERWSALLASTRVLRGTASTNGRASARLTLPRGTHTLRLQVTGARSARTGGTTLRILGARTFKASLRSGSVHRSRTQRVVFSGLAAHEPARISYRGTRIWTGHASATGRVARTFKVGRSLGAQSVRIRGAFADRGRTASFRVVR
jgi:hypothetical protein